MPDGDDWIVCSGCGQRLSVAAQGAFARAEAAFLSAQGSQGYGAQQGVGRRPYTAKARPDSFPLAPEVIHDLQQTYAGLTTAFRFGLPEAQERAGAEMMAETMRLLAPRGMASALEAEYWIKLAFQLTARCEMRTLVQRLDPAGAFLGPLSRIRCTLRLRQLTRVSAKLRRDLEQLERAIGFVEPPGICT